MNKIKRILAIICIIFLVALYVIAFVLSLTDNPQSMHAFALAIVATVVIPVFIYAYTLIFKWARNRREYNQIISSSPGASGENMSSSSDADGENESEQNE